MEDERTFLDDGFKIKKKSKVEDNSSAFFLGNADTSKQPDQQADVVVLKVPDVNVSKCFDQIREKSYNDKELCQKLYVLMVRTNKNLVEKQAQLKKKWYHLKTSNLGEKEYRMKDKALQKAEIDEINEIKAELLMHLVKLELPGLESQAELEAKLIAQDPSHKMSKNLKFVLDEKGLAQWSKSQMALLEKLMASDFSTYASTSKPVANEIAELDAEAQAAKRRNEYQPAINRREKKPTITKLSRYMRDLMDKFPRGSEIPSEEVQKLPPDAFHTISTAELDKINDLRSDKTYYDEKLIESQFGDLKKFLQELQKQIGDRRLDSLTDEQAEKLVDAVSFSLNGVHYQQKLRKTKYMIHPIEILYILSKL